MNTLIDHADDAFSLSRDRVQELISPDADELDALLGVARSLRDQGHGKLVTYSPKVFIPLTHLCRDVCHYCTFAETPKQARAAYLTPEQVLDIARAGAAAGCHEALFTLGDKPELRYQAARDALEAMGYASTIDYLEAMCRLVLDETGLLPHANPGVVTGEQLDRLRRVSVSQGMMLESLSDRLCGKGQAHHGSPDKDPAVRMRVLTMAGERRIPYTTGILIGIGETRAERIEALTAVRDLHAQYGHIQEVIIQAFQPKPGTRLADRPAPPLDDLKWTIAVARLLFGPEMNIQAPPNLSSEAFAELIGAGINDWGGVSPVTPDYVNPEKPWPALDRLGEATRQNGKILVPRLPLYPAFVHDREMWLDRALHPAVLRRIDATGHARDGGWVSGAGGMTDGEKAALEGPAILSMTGLDGILDRAVAGSGLSDADIVGLFEARDGAAVAVMAAADAVRAEVNGETITYVVNRNINYTNVCTYKCQFCAFSKGRGTESLRGAPYDLDLEEIVRRSIEAFERGATEVCLQGGIHPDYTGKTYLAILRAIRAAVPDLHVHAFSPLEVFTGAASLGLPVDAFLVTLRDAGLRSLPGTAAEILVDEVRQTLCPDKLNTAEWLMVMKAAHGVGLRTTATIMFGHVDGYGDWARHLNVVRDLQQETGGFTEFVPLPFVSREAPLYKQGRSRQGPTLREAVLMHAVARLALNPVIPNIQTSWTKMGPEAAALALQAGVNDLGGTLMNESISRAAGSSFGQELTPDKMAEIARAIGRPIRQRTTLYGEVQAGTHQIGSPPPLLPPVNKPAGKRSNIAVN